MARDHDIACPQRPGVLADLSAPDEWQALGGVVGRLVAEVARKRALRSAASLERRVMSEKV